MNLLFNVVYAAHCRSTHHKMAMDALRKLSGMEGELWSRMFLKHHQWYLKGAKDPDTTFKDFRNHVLHVSQNNWGGAPKAARMWYDNTLEHLRARKWREAVYSAGVLSHYYTDPIQPFHTGQSKAENNIHRAAEWSITKSYADLYELAQQFGWPDVTLAEHDRWLEQAVIDGARTSHEFYQPLIDHYDLNAGRKDPPAGLDRYSREKLARLIAYAVVGWSQILQRLFRESGMVPPEVSLSIESVLATVEVPIRWVTKKMADVAERHQIEAMYAELQETGQVDRTLPEDDRVIRDLVTEEITNRKTPAKPVPRKTIEEPATVAQAAAMFTPPKSSAPNPQPKPPQTKSKFVQPEPLTEITSKKDDSSNTDFPSNTVAPGQARSKREEPKPTIPLNWKPKDLAVPLANKKPEPAKTPPPKNTVQSPPVQKAETKSLEESSLRFYLELDSDVVDAPSIGPKTAKRFYKIGIKTVRQLLNCDPDASAAKINMRHIPAKTIVDWQDQARLVCCIPELRGHDAQIMTACDYRTVDDVATANHAELTKAAMQFAKSKEGERIIRSGKGPDAQEVSDWIRWAKQSRSLKAA